MKSMKRVVVTGMGAITPIGNSVEEFWSGVKEQKIGFAPITYFDATEYKAHLAAEVKGFNAKDYMSPKAARRMELFSQYAVAATKEAIEDAGLDLEKEDTTSANLVEDVTEETAEEPTEEASSADITAEDITTELVTTEDTEVTTTEETELAKSNGKKSKKNTTEATDKKQQTGIEATEATEEATAGAILVEDDSYQPGTYLGTFTTTAYCGCSYCCGKSDGITASGTYATEGRTIAAPSNFAFGTELIIDGHTYVVEDRGGAIRGNRIDIFFSSHQAALNYGRRTVDVYVK